MLTDGVLANEHGIAEFLGISWQPVTDSGRLCVLPTGPSEASSIPIFHCRALRTSWKPWSHIWYSARRRHFAGLTKLSFVTSTKHHTTMFIENMQMSCNRSFAYHKLLRIQRTPRRSYWSSQLHWWISWQQHLSQAEYSANMLQCQHVQAIQPVERFERCFCFLKSWCLLDTMSRHLAQVLVEGALENAQNDKEADKNELQEKLKRAATQKQTKVCRHWLWKSAFGPNELIPKSN